jgi:hypothetical protein
MKRLPPESLLELGDFVQEGYSVVREMEPSYDPEQSKFTTYIFWPLIKRFQNMVRDEHQHYGNLVEYNDGLNCNSGCAQDQCRITRVLNAISILAEDHPELADLIINGVPDDLLIFAKADMRSKCLRLGRDPSNCQVRFNRNLLAGYCGISERKLMGISKKILDLV